MALDYANPEPPFEWYRRAKGRGTWDPEDIDLEIDKRHWAERFTGAERRQFLKVCSLFYEGEESVTRALAPYPMAVGALEDPGFDTLQEEMYLTTHLWEEAKHAEFFSRYFEEVFGTQDTLGGGLDDVENFWVPEAEYWIVDGLEEVSTALRRAIDEDQDTLRRALARALVHYMGIVEAELAETGYTGIEMALEQKDALPGFRAGIEKTRADEGRHVANGRWLMTRLADEDPSIATEVYEPRLNEFLEDGLLPTVNMVLSEGALDLDVGALTERARTNYKATVDAVGADRFESPPAGV